MLKVIKNAVGIPLFLHFCGLYIEDGKLEKWKKEVCSGWRRVYGVGWGMVSRVCSTAVRQSFDGNIQVETSWGLAGCCFTIFPFFQLSKMHVLEKS